MGALEADFALASVQPLMQRISMSTLKDVGAKALRNMMEEKFPGGRLENGE